MRKLGGLFTKAGIKKAYVDWTQAGLKVQAGWTEIMGELAKDLAFDMIKNGILYIKTPNFAWVNEIEYLKPHILEKANKWAKRPKIKDVKVIQGELPQPRKEKENIFEGLSFEEKIIKENELKKKKGYTLCNTCKQVLSIEPLCDFCKVES